ncbi:MAG: pyridoxine 5'-phosphate synthase [Bacteroidota bacterium]|nr:pyridoxine 5'-phosphate synthase [Bacteroidota bacterium]
MASAKLSVNINKIATLRNARGGNLPNVLKWAEKIESFGAHGITVHPRPDQRHIRYEDVHNLKNVITTELNVEGNPTPRFIQLIEEVKPDQVTLVPDAPEAITSNHGWDCKKHLKKLQEYIAHFKSLGCRTSIFLDPNEEQIAYAYQTKTDRIELYTEFYAKNYLTNQKEAISDYQQAAQKAIEFGLGINAGHDLNLDNLAYFQQNIPNLMEVSIGHALISDALHYGMSNTIKLYLNQLTA